MKNACRENHATQFCASPKEWTANSIDFQAVLDRDNAIDAADCLLCHLLLEVAMDASTQDYAAAVRFTTQVSMRNIRIVFDGVVNLVFQADESLRVHGFTVVRVCDADLGSLPMKIVEAASSPRNYR